MLKAPLAVIRADVGLKGKIVYFAKGSIAVLVNKFALLGGAFNAVAEIAEKVQIVKPELCYKRVGKLVEL